jgi:hypothetical protein
MLESLKIIAVCILAAILYGIVFDQFTTRICLEYFTVFHPPIFPTRSPTLLAFGWGIIATWWVGAFLGVLLAIAARAGSRPKLTAASLLPLIGEFLLIVYVCALVAGITGFVLARKDLAFAPSWIESRLSLSSQHRFVADFWAHCMSYASGFVGGIFLCLRAYRRRVQY